MVGEFALLALQVAHEGGESGSGIPEWLPRLFNLLLFLGIVYFLIRKGMDAFFASRSAAITEALTKAEREKKAAEAKLNEVNARLAGLDSERDRIRNEAEAEAEAEHARIQARAQEDAEKIAETAEREIEGALKSARASLQQFVAEKSVELAEATIRSEMNEADRHRIVEEYTEQLEEMKP